MRILACHIGCVLLLTVPSLGVTVSVEVPELTGLYVYGDADRVALFDLEQQFASFSNATVSVTGFGTPGLLRICDLFDPTNCVTEPFDPTALYQFDGEGSSGPFGSIGPFEGTPQTFEDSLIQPSRPLDFLLDGVGEMSLGHDILVFIPEVTVEILTPAVFEITNVTIIADDTENCTSDGTRLCLNGDRFRVEVFWRDFDENVGTGQVVLSGDDSGIVWFFSEDNWEMMIKVLTGCHINNHFWVFAAATTNVEYTLQVTDTETGEMKVYRNLLGVSSPAITDTVAFATCP